MTQEGAAIGVVGAGTELGREVCRVIRGRGFPVRAWRLFDSGPEDPGVIDEELDEPVRSGERIDVQGLDFVFLCGPDAQGAAWSAPAAAAGAIVIDLTRALADRSDVPLLVPEVNPETAAECIEQRMVVSPVAGAVSLSIVLNPLEQMARLRRVVVSSLAPVSEAGRPGIDELSRQTLGLMSGEDAAVEVFPARIAFNVIPQVGDFLTGGRTRGEWLIESQTRRLLDLPDLPLIVTALRVPAFFGHGSVINIETEEPVDAEAARTVLRQAPGILLLEELDVSHPTLADAIGEEAVCVGRVRDDPTVPFGICLWAAVDGLQKGGAVNAVQIAEVLRRERMA